MSTQAIDVSSVKLVTLETFALKEDTASEETAPAETEQAVPDEFELRRKLFFGA